MLKTIKQVASTMNTLENLNCLTREVFSGIMTSVVSRLAISFTSNLTVQEIPFLSGVAPLGKIAQRAYKWRQEDKWIVIHNIKLYHDAVSVSRFLSGIHVFELSCKHYTKTILLKLLATERSFVLPQWYIAKSAHSKSPPSFRRNGPVDLNTQKGIQILQSRILSPILALWDQGFAFHFLGGCFSIIIGTVCQQLQKIFEKFLVINSLPSRP